MFFGKISCIAVGLTINNEVDTALTVQNHVFGAMPGNQGEAH